MFELPPELAAFGAFRQWILWKLVPDPKGGKPIKVPCSPHTGRMTDAHAPQEHVDAATAFVAAERFGIGVAFVFTERDPFWFLDIDDCLDGHGNWNPGEEEAQALLQRFPGAAVEISQSGKGLHVFGQTATRPNGHRTRPRKETRTRAFEFYTTGRYCAHTFNMLGGLASVVLTENVDTLVADQLIADEPVAIGWQWTRDPDWRGPEDDEALIAKMLARRPTAAAAFDGQATLQHLWVADDGPLSVSYPPDKNESGPYNHSSADAALLSHLAFWTGRDPERMERLFERSALSRDKWTDRPDYRRRTIAFACTHCANVYQQPAPAVDTLAAPGVPIVPEVLAPDEVRPAVQPAEGLAPMGFVYVAPDQQAVIFNPCCLVGSVGKVFVPGEGLVSPGYFRGLYGNRAFAMRTDGAKVTGDAYRALVESECHRLRTATDTCFLPTEPPYSIVEHQGRRYVNTYAPIPVDSSPGDVSPFIGHLRKLATNERDAALLLSFMAFIVQNPGVKLQWCPLIQGVEGNGKTLLLRVMAAAIGDAHCHFPNSSDLANKFNAWLPDKIFIGVEEIYTRDRIDLEERLKVFVTNEMQEVQGKGSDQVTKRVVANFMLCTNHPDALHITANSRRFAIFFTPQQTVEDLARDGLTESYFHQIYEWLRAEGYAHTTDFLRNYQIPNELNPGTTLQRAPITSTTHLALAESMSPAELKLREAIESDRIGFRGGWIGGDYLAVLFERTRLSGRDRLRLLQRLGYVPHPALVDGRATQRVGFDGSKPRLYCRADSPLMALNTADAQRAYVQAQQAAA